ncbi:MAG: hypothetical protein M3R08_09500 [Bacteroidota bacterium]|nr:hypothetical protein [Bacteroidota bacterium]
MKKTILALVVLLSIFGLYTCGTKDLAPRDQRTVKLDPEFDKVAWAVIPEQIDGDKWTVTFKSEIDDGWSVYSTNSYGDMGPWPSSFHFDTLAHVLPTDSTMEESVHTIEGHDPVFDMLVKKFKHQVDFKRDVRLLLSDIPFTGRFEYMTCNDETCLPPATVYYEAHPDSGTFRLSPVPFDLSGYMVVSCADGVYKLPGVDLKSPLININM